MSEHLFSGTKARKTAANIEIDFDASRFRVKDGCGGISLNEAREHVFLLGNPVADKKHTGLGVYGIGMKRAFFKMGRRYQSYRTRPTKSSRLTLMWTSGKR